MEVAVVASLFAERDVDVDAARLPNPQWGCH